MKTKSYYFGSSPVNEIERSVKIKQILLETIARRKLTMNGQIISGAFLLLNETNEIIGFCPLAACLYLRPHPWKEYDFHLNIAQKLNLSYSEIDEFILGFDGRIGDTATVWYLLGAELREKLQPESNYQVLEP
jgi:hypothetical protein